MSADNWTICPKCTKERPDPIKEAAKLYGKIPLAEWEAAIQEAKNSPPQEATLREDYEFYLKGFCLNIIYCCSCKLCGFKFDYKKQVDIKET